MSNGCIFCAIAAGQIPARIVCESENLVAFLDIQPVREGHTLIIPRAHYRFFDDMPAELAQETIVMGQKIARAQKKLWGVERVGFMYSGVDVAHAHAHLVPMQEPTDLTSRRYIVEENLTFRHPPRVGPEALETVGARLEGALKEPA
ncbi:HIT family protein [Camelimonas abortus]|uniref:HIT family protein n=1 Tax=Camelimonas abortus TaxID=1017184 RepID=A0ABV7LEX6_9HYPH